MSRLDKVCLHILKSQVMIGMWIIGVYIETLSYFFRVVVNVIVWSIALQVLQGLILVPSLLLVMYVAATRKWTRSKLLFGLSLVFVVFRLSGDPVSWLYGKLLPVNCNLIIYIIILTSKLSLIIWMAHCARALDVFNNSEEIDN